MTSLLRTRIEYAAKDGKPGYAWNWLRGCANGPDICKTRDLCWAKSMAVRFKKGNFTPRFDPVAFNASFPRKPGARILVCFTGDISYAEVDKRYLAASRMAQHPEHTFILLTKRPAAAYTIGMLWPRNVLLGASLTGAETVERQKQVLDELRAIQGQHLTWVSYEPMLGPLAVSLEGIDWLVMGAQTGEDRQSPQEVWYEKAIKQVGSYHIRLWEKKNLFPYFDSWAFAAESYPIQEFPQEVEHG